MKTKPVPRSAVPFETWLRRLLAGLVISFGLLFLALAGYAVRGRYAVVLPANAALERGDLVRALDLLEEPHLFSGYAPWHGFGPGRAAALADAVEGLVVSGQDYGEKQLPQLVGNASFWITAAREHRVQGVVPWVPGDEVILRSLLSRWENAQRNTVVTLVYLGVVVAILGALLFAYLRFDLFRRIAPLPPGRESGTR
ncbi:MAG: hypothetical protein FJ098_13480, partial [Deltaproteobacteria bacterium]|nr:hypothetical protein [Deltaproteobacteria bacterium]